MGAVEGEEEDGEDLRDGYVEEEVLGVVGCSGCCAVPLALAVYRTCSTSCGVRGMQRLRSVGGRNKYRHSRLRARSVGS